MDRFFKLCLTCCLVAGMAACGPKDNNENNTNNGTAGTNNTTSSNNNSNNETNNETNNNETNNNETNNNTSVDGQCNAAGEDCTEGDPTNAGFVCVESTCREECDPNADPTDCRSGAVCFQNPNGAQEFYCQPSDCNGWLDESSCDAGEQCVALVNDADICFPVGNLGEGDACEQTDMNPFPCGAGLFCAFGECQALCGDNSDCDEAGGERCINNTLGEGVGICEVGCDSFSRGQCPDGQGCFPVTPEDGVCEENTGTGDYYQFCDPPAEGEDDPCGENSACIAFQGEDAANGIDGIGRCLPFCDITADSQAASDATCPTASDSGYGRFTHLTEGAGAIDVYVDGTLVVDDLAFGATSAGFEELSTGMHTVDVVAGADADNSSPIRTFTPTVAAGAAVTWGVVPDATDTIDVIMVDVPRNVTAPTAGNATIRAVHGIPDFANVDVVAVAAGATDFTAAVELALDLPFGSAGAFATVPAADYDIYIFPAGAARDTANAGGVTVAGVTVADMAHASVYARGTADDTDGADPGLTNVAYASAPAARSLGGSCTDLSGGNPDASIGFCFEECPDAATYGTGACSAANDRCQPFRGTDVCFPGGPNAVGDACDPANLDDGCGPGAYCERFGDETGVCRAYCETNGTTNPSLACDTGEVCLGTGAVGSCSVECTPSADNTDTAACPANLQTCFPADDPICEANGSAAVGDSCDPFASVCSAGDVCVNDFGSGNLDAEDPFAIGACYATCDPFAADTGCAGGEICSVDILNVLLGQPHDMSVGFCTAADEDLNYGDGCSAELNLCGDRGYCLDIGQGPQCLELCNTADGSTCSAGSCTELFEGTGLGGCI